LRLDNPEFIGTLSVSIKCGNVNITHKYTPKNNRVLSQVVYTSRFAKKNECEIIVQGINRSGFKISHSLAERRSELSRQDLMTIDPNLLLQSTSVTLDDAFAVANLRDEVIEVKAEYILNRETHKVWLGYLRSGVELKSVFPRQNYGGNHEFFKLEVVRLNIVSGASKSYKVRYTEIPESLLVDEAWFNKSGEQERKIIEESKTGEVKLADPKGGDR
jgi:hypothetical protein